MKLINRLCISHPVTLCFILVLLSILFTQMSALILSNLLSGSSAGELSVYTRYACCILIGLLLWRLGGLSASGISRPVAQWHKNWLLLSLPMLVVVALNLFRVQWGDLSIAIAMIPGWLFTHLASGMFEELMMRAMVFYILVRAWSAKPDGLLKAALVQAAIFGALHLLNLLNGFSIAVLMQVIYATLLGISFAGLVAISRTVWPAVLCHALINASGSINRSFVPEYIDSPASLSAYAGVIVIIFICTTLPALFLLRQYSQSEINRYMNFNGQSARV